MPKKTEFPWKCPKKHCKGTAANQWERKQHLKACVFKKKRIAKRRKSNNTSDMDFSLVLVGSSPISSGGYGKVFPVKLGNVEMVMKESISTERAKMESFDVEISVLKEIHKSKNEPGFPTLFHHTNRVFCSRIFLEKLDYTIGHFLTKIELNSLSLSSLMKKMLNRVEFLHKCGFIHRDLKLNNFMFKHGEVYLIDFGACIRPGSPKHKDSIFGTLEYLSKRAPNFTRQSFVDDLESLGWIFMEVVHRRQPLPWDEETKLYRETKQNFKIALNKVSELKKAFLENKSLKNSSNEFVFDYLNYVREIPFSELFDESIYRHLEALLSQYCLKNKTFGSSEEWRIVLKSSPPLVTYGYLTDFNLPKYSLGFFSIDSLPKQFLHSYQVKELLTLSIIVGTCQKFGKFEVLDLTQPNSQRRFKSVLDSGKSTLWLVFEKIGSDGHFSVYVTFKKPSTLISFNGLYDKDLFPEVYNRIRFRNVQVQPDDWSCGYRAIFWLMEVLRMEKVDEWLRENGYWDFGQEAIK